MARREGDRSREAAGAHGEERKGAVILRPKVKPPAVRHANVDRIAECGGSGGQREVELRGGAAGRGVQRCAPCVARLAVGATWTVSPVPTCPKVMATGKAFHSVVTAWMFRGAVTCEVRAADGGDAIGAVAACWHVGGRVSGSRQPRGN